MIKEKCYHVMWVTQIILSQLEPETHYCMLCLHKRCHTGVMDYDEACFMHLTPGVVHNFPKAVGV